MVAARMPLRTQAWPVFGKPSQPVKGNLSQRSRSVSLSSPWKALRAPTAMASFCEPIRSMAALCEVVSLSQERTERSALSSVHCARSMATWIFAGLVSCMPMVRCLAAEFSAGPWI